MSASNSTPPPPSTPTPSRWAVLTAILSVVKPGIDTITAISSGLTALFGALEGWSAYVTAAFFAVAFVSGGYYVFRRLRQHRRPIRVDASDLRTSIRGARHLQEGDTLFARDASASARLVSHDTYRFGYLAGGAGIGKTSFVLAGIKPTLEASGVDVLYVDCATEAPSDDLHRAITAFCARKRIDHRSMNRTARLSVVLAALMEACGSRRLVVIFDGYERYISSISARERRPIESEIGEVCCDRDLAVGVLLTIQDGFKDGLKGFEEILRDPTFNHDNLRRLDAWSRDEVAEFLAKASELDGRPFGNAAVRDIAAEVTSRGKARPLEAQIVAYRLLGLESRGVVNNIASGQVHKILADHILDQVAPADRFVPELEREVAIQTLLVLADQSVGAEGLDRRDLSVAVRDKLLADVRFSESFATRAFERALSASIDRCVAARLVVCDYSGRFSVAHEGLEPAIRRVANLPLTAEHEAARIVDYYRLSRASGRPELMRLREYLFVRRNGSASLLNDEATRRELKVAFSQYAVSSLLTAALVAVSSVAALAVAQLAQGPVPSFDRRENDRREWVLAADGGIAVGRSDDGSLEVWDTADSKKVAEVQETNFGQAAVSDDGRFIVGQTRDGKLNLLRADEEWRAGTPLLESMVAGGGFPHFGFSRDNSTLYAFDKLGDIYVWSLADQPLKARRIGRLKQAVPDIRISGPIPPVLIPNVPQFTINHDGKWIAISDAWLFHGDDAEIDSGGEFFVVSTTDDSTTGELQPVFSEWVSPVPQVSADGKWIAAKGPRGIYAWRPGIDEVPMLVFESSMPTDVIAFDPTSRHLLIGTPTLDFFVWSTDRPDRQAAKLVTIGTENDRDILFPFLVFFSKDGRWAGRATPSSGVWLWKMAADERSEPVQLRFPINALPEMSQPAMPLISFSPNSDFVYVWSESRDLYATRLKEPFQELSRVLRSTGSVGSIRFSADGGTAFVIDGSKIWHGRTGGQMAELIEFSAQVQALAVTTDCRGLTAFGPGHVTTATRAHRVLGYSVWDKPWEPLDRNSPTKGGAWLFGPQEMFRPRFPVRPPSPGSSASLPMGPFLPFPTMPKLPPDADERPLVMPEREADPNQ